jgi:hypothetical protein
MNTMTPKKTRLADDDRRRNAPCRPHALGHRQPTDRFSRHRCHREGLRDSRLPHRSVQRSPHVVSALWAVGGILLEQGGDELVQRGPRGRWTEHGAPACARARTRVPQGLPRTASGRRASRTARSRASRGRFDCRPRRPRACSGEMYFAVPRTFTVAVGASGDRSLAIPMSASLTPPGGSRTFDGLTSRWITPCTSRSQVEMPGGSRSPRLAPARAGPLRRAARGALAPRRVPLR